MEQWIREIKVFFDKKTIEIYQLPATDEDVEAFFLNPKSPWVKSTTPMPLRLVLLTQSVSESATVSMPANFRV